MTSFSATIASKFKFNLPFYAEAARNSFICSQKFQIKNFNFQWVAGM